MPVSISTGVDFLLTTFMPLAAIVAVNVALYATLLFYATRGFGNLINVWMAMWVGQSKQTWGCENLRFNKRRSLSRVDLYERGAQKES